MLDAAKDARASRAVRTYMMFCFAALLVMVPALLLKGMDLWSLLPLLLGALSLLAHWRAGPVFVLLSVAVLVPLRARGYDPILCCTTCLEFGRPPPFTGSAFTPQTPFLDCLLAMCVLAYVAGHYRLQGLVHNVVPPERWGSVLPARLKVRPMVDRVNPRRVPGVLPKWEVPLLVLLTVLCGLGAAVTWAYLLGLTPAIDMSPIGWRTLVFIWISALLLFVAWGAFGYLACRRASREESLMYLQDQVWRQTRREQSSINRWLTARRLRWQRWKENEP